MNRVSSSLTLAFIIGLLTSLGANGQIGQKDGLQVRFLAPAVPDSGLKVALRGENSASDFTAVTTHGLSEPLFPKERKLLLVEGTDDITTAKPIGGITLPPGRDFLIILIPSKDKWKTKLVRLDSSKFGASTICLVNLTPKNIACTFDEDKVLLKSGELEIVSTPKKKDDRNFYQIQFFAEKGGKPKRFADTRWPHDPRVRSVVFYYIDKFGRLTYRAIDEVV